MFLQNETLQLKGLRGAITCEENTKEAIEVAANELIKALISRNSLIPARILSMTFSVTKDLNACFPASIARRQEGWENVALLDCQQMYVEGDLKYCIRILAHTLLPINQEPHHVYLKKATLLRPDRSSKS